MYVYEWLWTLYGVRRNDHIRKDSVRERYESKQSLSKRADHLVLKWLENMDRLSEERLTESTCVKMEESRDKEDLT